MVNVTPNAVELSMQGREHHALAQQIGRLYQQWDTGKSKARDRWKEVTEYIFATDTRSTTNVSNPWSHTTHIPKLTQIYDNLGANYAAALFGNREFFVFEPGDVESADAAKRTAVRQYLQTKHALSDFIPTMKMLLNDYVHYGNAFCKLEYVRFNVVGAADITVLTYEGPKLYRISPYDITFDYTAVDFKSAPKVVRSLVSRGELMETMTTAPERVYDPVVVEQVRKFSGIVYNVTAGDIAKIEQQQFDGFSSVLDYYKSGKVEILEFFGTIYDPMTQTLYKDELITIADRRFVLRHQKLSDLGSLGQIYHCGWRKRPDNLWAMGPLDNLVGMQYLVDHLENARADAFDQMINPDRVIKGAVSVEKVGAAVNYIIADGSGDVKNLSPETTALNAEFQIERKEAQMEAYAGAPREAMGIRTPGEKTAFEFRELQNAAGRLFQNKIEQFEGELVELVLNGELELSARNLNSVDKIQSVDGPDGVVTFTDISKDDLTVRGKLRARGASHFAKRAQLVQELQGFETVLQQAPDLKVHYPGEARGKAWNEALGFERFKLFVPFGGVAEQAKLQKQLAAAQETVDQHEAAGQVVRQRSPV